MDEFKFHQTTDTTQYIVQLYKDGAPYAKRSLDCGHSTFIDSCKQWKRNGFVVKVLKQPKKNS